MRSMRGRSIYLGVVALGILLFHLASGLLPVMNGLAAGALRVKQALGRLCGILPFSVAELLVALCVLAVAAWLVWTVLSLRKPGRRLAVLWRRVSLLLAAALTVYLLLCLLLGASYRADSFQSRSGLTARAETVETLYQTTALFVDRLCETADSVPRDEQGCFAQPLDQVFSDAPAIYRGAEEKYPFLTLEDCIPKRMFFSRLMSRFQYTGFYFPFTGEANINVDVEPCMIPATIAHEMAHQRGVASEQEANFVAILACAESGNAAYAYSGWLFGFVHLGSALYRYSPDSYYALAARLPDSVRADLTANNAYWAQFESKMAEVSEKVYDVMLKSYGQTLGVQSYGAVVDLLIAYAAQGGFR